MREGNKGSASQPRAEAEAWLPQRELGRGREIQAALRAGLARLGLRVGRSGKGSRERDEAPGGRETLAVLLPL